MATDPEKPRDTYIQVPHKLLMSEAFDSLPPIEVKILLGIARQYVGYNNGHIGLSERQAGEIAHTVNRMRIRTAFATLRRRGFLVCTYKGRRISPTQRIASRWEVTCFRTQLADGTFTDPTDDYMRWRPTEAEPDPNVEPPTTTVEETTDYAPRKRASRAKPKPELKELEPDLEMRAEAMAAAQLRAPAPAAPPEPVEDSNPQDDPTHPVYDRWRGTELVDDDVPF